MSPLQRLPAVTDRHAEGLTAPSLPGVDVDELLQVLGGCSAASTSPAPVADEVVLDFEVRGVRYRIIRCGPGDDSLFDVEGGADGDGTSSSGLLSPRELEIARMVAKGYADKSIASILEISRWTVSSHLRRIYGKLGVKSRAAMVARLLDDGRGEPGLVDAGRDLHRGRAAARHRPSGRP